MAGTTANMLTNPAVSASGANANNLIERFTGLVRTQLIRREQLGKYLQSPQDVVGTNQVTNKAVGETEIQNLVAGQEPTSSPTEVDNYSLVVDTVIIARNTMALLHKVQSDIQLQMKIADNQAKKLVKLNDETYLTQIIVGANATDGRVAGKEGGDVVVLEAGEELDPIAYLDAIRKLAQAKNEKELDNIDLTFCCPWEQYYILQDNDQITSGDYVAGGAGSNGNKVKGRILKAYNMPIVPTNRIRQKPHDTSSDDINEKHHNLSNAQNNYRYDTTEAIKGCVGVMFGRNSLMIGRTMGMEHDIFQSKLNKSYYLDSWESFGAIADELEECGAIMSPDMDNLSTPDVAQDQKELQIAKQ